MDRRELNLLQPIFIPFGIFINGPPPPRLVLLYNLLLLIVSGLLNLLLLNLLLLELLGLLFIALYTSLHGLLPNLLLNFVAFLGKRC
jgi:hypothetical protein